MQGHTVRPHLPAADAGPSSWGANAPAGPPPHPSEQRIPVRPRMVSASEGNGVSFLPPPAHLPLQQMASDLWGCGTWYNCHWFQLRWDGRSEGLPIMVKELLPIVLACAVWGQRWTHTCVRCLCDNQAVVACLRSRTTRDKHCMHMLRTLAFVEARHAFSLRPEYINTKDNHLADDLSRDNLVPNADAGATPLPECACMQRWRALYRCCRFFATAQLLSICSKDWVQWHKGQVGLSSSSTDEGWSCVEGS